MAPLADESPDAPSNRRRHLDPEHAKALFEGRESHAHRSPDVGELVASLRGGGGRSGHTVEASWRDGTHRVALPAADCVNAYFAWKRERQLLDYQDLIQLAVLAIEADPHLDLPMDVVLADEFQDTDPLQYRLLEAWRQRPGRDPAPLYCVGDERQLIYGWRGVDVATIRDLGTRTTMQRRELTVNFRSTTPILEVANRSLGSAAGPGGSTLRAAGGRTGERVDAHEFADANLEALWHAERILWLLTEEKVPPSDIAVLARTGGALNLLDTQLTRHSIPYHVVAAKKFAEREEIRDAAGWFRMITNPGDDPAVERSFERLEGVGKRTIERLRSLAGEHGTGSFAALPHLRTLRGIQHRTAEAADWLRIKVVELADALDARPRPEKFMHRLLHETGIWDRATRDLESADPDRRAIAEGRRARLEDLIHIAAGQRDLLDLNDLLVVEDIGGRDDDPGGERVTLSTVHGAKGLEWPIVSILAVEEDVLPLVSSQSDPDALEEERRIFHVAATRAARELTITWSLRRRGNVAWPSSFLKDVLAHMTFERHAWPERDAA